MERRTEMRMRMECGIDQEEGKRKEEKRRRKKLKCGPFVVERGGKDRTHGPCTIVPR